MLELVTGRPLTGKSTHLWEVCGRTLAAGGGLGRRL